MTERCLKALESQGLAGTPVQLVHAMDALFGEEAMPFSASAPILGISEQESKLRTKIQKRCNSIDRIRGVMFGTTNGEMRGYFNLSRTQMSVSELLAALKWLDQTYPIPAYHDAGSADIIA